MTFHMHYKYSIMLNIVFVTMLYGAGMPIMFPISFVSLLCLYIVEKFLLYYGYREPPNFDDELNNRVMSHLKYAPLFFLASSYWMLSNRQLFSNDTLIPKMRKNESYDPGHYFTSAFKIWSRDNISEDGPAFVLFVAFFLYLLFLFSRKLNKLGFSAGILSKFDTMKILREGSFKEVLDNYYRCLNNDAF
jgi:hypothetical protein